MKITFELTKQELALIDRAIFSLLQRSEQSLQSLNSQPNCLKHDFEFRKSLKTEQQDLQRLYRKINSK